MVGVGKELDVWFFGMFLQSHQVSHHVFTRSTHEISSGNFTKLWKMAQL